MSHYSQCSSVPDSQSTRRRSQRLVSLSSNSQKPSGLLPSSSYDFDQSSFQPEIEHFSLDASLTEEESDNVISSDQQLLSQISINNAERSVENMSRVDSTLSSNPVPSRDAPSTNQTPPIGTGSFSLLFVTYTQSFTPFSPSRRYRRCSQRNFEDNNSLWYMIIPMKG